MEKSQYKVSIGIPVYGVEKFIERCARSLFEQTYENLEYIFVDDFSPDKSIEILKHIIGQYPNRKHQIHIIRHDFNKGLACARNTFIANAKGEFVLHVDSDDWIERNAIELLVDKQKHGDYDIVTADTEVIRPEYTEVRNLPQFDSPMELTLALLRRTIPVNVWGRLIRKSLYTENKIWASEGVNMSEDLNVMPRLSYYAKNIASIRKVLFHYDCFNENSYTANFNEEKQNMVWKTIDILQKFFLDKDPIYQEGLKFGIMKSLSIPLMIIGKNWDDKNKFEKLKKKQSEYSSIYLAYLDTPTRIAMKINNYYLFCCYVHFAVFIKRIIKMIK